MREAPWVVGMCIRKEINKSAAHLPGHAWGLTLCKRNRLSAVMKIQLRERVEVDAIIV
jgi:hypothetical protein